MKRNNMTGMFFLAVAAVAVLTLMLVPLRTGTGPHPGSAQAAAGPVLEPSLVRVRPIGPDGQVGDPVETPRVTLSDDEWRKQLTPAQYAIVRGKGTERAFTGALLKNKADGYYLCVACALPLFGSETKYESGSGWPSFYQPLAPENVRELQDSTLGMRRTEILCTRCDAHLGHVFDDGPRPTGLRYCLNSESLQFVSKEHAMTFAETPQTPKVGGSLPMPVQDIALADEPGKATAVFAGGCFWCTEAVFEELDGVSEVVSGYCGGDPKRADYESVCSGSTGHAEAIRITYDPSRHTYGQLLRIFFATHDPTTKDRQGPDSGTQYRSAVFFEDERQKEVAAAYIQQLTAAEAFPKPIVTTLEPLTKFFDAEDYHQDFAASNPMHPYVRTWAIPKVKKLHGLLGESESS